MLLSSNIPVQQLVTDFICTALPNVHEIYVIAQYPNGGTQIQTRQGEYNDKPPTGISHFLSSGNSGWYHLSETPFLNNSIIGQISLEMELEKDFLFLRNIDAYNCALHILVQLKPSGMQKNAYLLSDQKKQFETSIRGFVTSLLQTRNTDKDILKNIAKGNTLTRNEIRETKTQLTKQSENFEVAVSQFIQLIINKLQEKYGIVIKMSKAFIDELKVYNQPFEELEPNLEIHIQIELNLALIQGNGEIILMPTHLSSLSSTKATVIQQNQNDINLGRLTKTYNLLDRYENAAEAAQNKGLSIIGKNIGSNCVPSVSNASITDALNKQAKKVYELFQKYPQKWPIIRSEFKSVANIIERESVRRQNIA